MIATLRSLPPPQALRTQLHQLCGIPFTDCTLIRSLVNDVYELAALDGRYVLKLYRSAGWQLDEIRWEGELSTHLETFGLLVPRGCVARRWLPCRQQAQPVRRAAELGGLPWGREPGQRTAHQRGSRAARLRPVRRGMARASDFVGVAATPHWESDPDGGPP